MGQVTGPFIRNLKTGVHELAKKSPFENLPAQVEWEGERIKLPAMPQHMTLDEGITWLARIKAEDQIELAISEIIDTFPFDGAVAFMKAMRSKYGWASPLPQSSWWEQPPTMMSVDTGVGQKTSIIWGKFKVPGLDAVLVTQAHQHENRWVFRIGGQVRKKHMPQVVELAELTRQFVAEESIYKGKAIELQVNEEGEINLNSPPKFMDMSSVRRDEMIFTDDLMDQIQMNLFTPIMHTEACIKHQIPLKRGVLLEGPYGTGKTLCASATAQLCEEHGWTFITVSRVGAIKRALQFAAMYQPAVVFCEDIDRHMSGERSVAIDDILNTIDGIVSKGKAVITVLTSNSAEAINRAMLRPGRLDAVLRVDAPDAKAAEKLMRIYGRGLIPDHEDLTEAGKVLDGQIPAVIRECVERSKLYAVGQTGGDGEFTITGHHISASAKGMKRHLELLAGKVPDPETEEHKLGDLVGRIAARHVGTSDYGTKVKKMLQEIHERLNS